MFFKEGGLSEKGFDQLSVALKSRDIVHHRSGAIIQSLEQFHCGL